MIIYADSFRKHIPLHGQQCLPEIAASFWNILFSGRVAHMKEEARQTAAWEADLPAISHKTWQAENPDVRLGRTRQTSACHCSSPSGLPTNCGARLGVSHEFHRSPSCYLPAFHSIAIFSRANISEFSILIVFALIMVVRNGNSSTFGVIVSAL